MIVAGRYSFNNGLEEVCARYADLLAEIEDVIHAVDASLFRTKESKEKGKRRDKLLYAPTAMNRAFKEKFAEKGWAKIRVACEYSAQYYTEAYQARVLRAGAFREMDFVKRRLGIEVQFGKYSFMVYNVCAKMTIFSNMGIIDVGIEIVPIKELAENMSSGVSYFEQFVWDLEQRGIADIDIPVLILGIAA